MGLLGDRVDGFGHAKMAKFWERERWGRMGFSFSSLGYGWILLWLVLTDKERAISCLVLFVHAIFSFLDTTFARFNILTNIDSFHINIWLYTLQSISCPFSSFVSTKSFQRNRVLRHYASRVARQLQWRLHRSLKPGWPVKPQVALRPIAGMKAGTATQGRGVVVPLLDLSTSPNPSSSSPRILLPLTSCWRIGLRFSVMETVQVMCSFLVWVF